MGFRPGMRRVVECKRRNGLTFVLSSGSFFLLVSLTSHFRDPIKPLISLDLIDFVSILTHYMTTMYRFWYMTQILLSHNVTNRVSYDLIINSVRPTIKWRGLSSSATRKIKPLEEKTNWLRMYKSIPQYLRPFGYTWRTDKGGWVTIFSLMLKTFSFSSLYFVSRYYS